MIIQAKYSFLSLCLLSIIFIRCSDRERLNPIDPQNPETKGKIQSISIYSEFNSITLSWRPIAIDNLEGYKIYRKRENDSAFIMIQSVERKSRQYSDLGVTYFQRHTYRISAYTANYESPLSDTVSIIPGPSVVWITDAYNYRLIKLSYDCTHEISSISANGYPWAIAWNQINQSLWYTDLLLGHVYTYGMSNLQYYNSHSLIWDPVSIGLDETRNVAWIADANGKIIQIRPDLPSPVQEIESSFIEQPESIAIDNRRHYCWIADPGTRHVIKLITTDLTLIPSSATFQKPNAVAVNTTNGQCWVADSSRVIALSSRGDSIAVIYDSYNDALNIAINNVTGDIWVIDRLAADGSARLLRYDFAGNHQVEVSGLLKPTGIVVDESTNDCLITDSWNQRVLRISQSGNILFSNSKNLYFPAGIAIIYNDN